MFRILISLTALLAFGDTATAFQARAGFNVNIHSPGSPAMPSDHYPAASGQAGQWNSMPTPNAGYSGSWFSGPLSDLHGNPTAVDIEVSGSYGAYNSNWSNTTADDRALLNSGLAINSYYYSAQFDIHGLAPGDYFLYTYGLEGISSNDVSVQGTLRNTVMGSFSNGFVEGVTHTIHSITVVAGQPVHVSVLPHVYGLYGQVDGFQIVPEGGDIGVSYCDSTVNSTGLMAEMVTSGSRSAGANDLQLGVHHLPQNQYGYFIVSQDQGVGITPPASQGILCIGGSVGRHNRLGEVLFSGTTGAVLLVADTTDVPQPMGPVSITGGEIWNWQFWYRDNNPHSTSNFSDGTRIHFSN